MISLATLRGNCVKKGLLDADPARSEAKWWSSAIAARIVEAAELPLARPHAAAGTSPRRRCCRYISTPLLAHLRLDAAAGLPLSAVRDY